MNYDGITEVGTTNKSGGNHEYTLQILDKTGGGSATLESIMPIIIKWLHLELFGLLLVIACKELDNSQHQPWFNAHKESFLKGVFFEKGR